MIISRTPFRLSLGGGGTDLKEYYSQYGSFFISAAIKRFVYLTLNRRSIDDQIWLSYSKIEQVPAIQEIEHDLIRECLADAGVERGVEVHSVTELSGGTGMGSSGSFCVGLINALASYNGAAISQQDLAEKAFDIEANRLATAVGKQDQYIAAFGGIRKFEIDKDGKVTTNLLKIPPEAREHLGSSLMLFYTGVQRKAYAVLEDESSKIEKKKGPAVDSLHEIKEIGMQTAVELEKGNVDALGPLMHKHWTAKKKISSKMSLTWIDECYEFALSTGAMGGKIVGAGGGGFLMLFVPDYQARSSLKKNLEEKGLRYMPFDFEAEGSRIIMDDGRARADG